MTDGSRARTIVVPCFNEAARLDLQAFRDFRDDGGTRFLFVDDGSTDDTEAVLAGLVASDPSRFGLRVLERNSGKAEAVRSGLLAALREDPAIVGYWDADLATPLSTILPMCELLDSRPELQVVLGARVRLMGRSIERRAYRHYLGRVFATAASLILRLPVYDTQCGAKVFRNTPRLRRILEAPFRVDWTFDVELLARFLSSSGEEGVPDPQREIYEYPLSQWHDAPGSKLRITDYPRALAELATIYWVYARRASRPR